MIASYYVIKPVYTLIWHFLKLFRTQKKVILYCDDAFDATLFKNIQIHLKPVPVVAKNRSIATQLKKTGIPAAVLPSFPDAVLMFRNMAWKFPCNKIIKIGFEHGAYNFKRFSSAQYYNQFTIFFMTSQHDVNRIQKRGVTTVKAIGFPKIDSAFNGSITIKDLTMLAESLHLDPNKKTILFSATWDGSGMSAVHLWYKKLDTLCEQYNVLTTLHPWTSTVYREILRSSPKYHFIEEYEMLRYIMLADVCIGDTNSLIAEFCLLNKPVVTFRVPDTPRTMPDIIDLIERISIRIDTFDELSDALTRALSPTADSYTAARKEAVRLFFDEPDGNAGKRAAEHISQLIPELILD